MMRQALQAYVITAKEKTEYLANRVKVDKKLIDGTRLKKRSVLISGHQTSISIEDAFWERLKSICKESNKSLNQVITEVDENRSSNLSSTLRVFILNYNYIAVEGRDKLSA